MSNPTELPELNKLEALARVAVDWGSAEPGTQEQYLAAANPAAVLALIALARRAKPEGEAPQADGMLIKNIRRTLNNIKDATRLADVRSLANLGLGFLDAAPSAPGTPEAPTLPFPITAEEMAALRRFWECATDGEGYDVPAPMMRRLAEMGLLQRKSGAYYVTTEFGLYMLGEFTITPAEAERIDRAAQLDGGQEGSKSNG